MNTLLKNVSVSQERALGVRAGGDSETAPGLPEENTPDLRELFADELQDLREEAQKSGYREGLEQGTEEVRKELDARWKKLSADLVAEKDSLSREIQKLVELAASLSVDQDEDVLAIESKLVELTLVCLHKILGSPALADDIVRQLVAEALREFQLGSEVAVRIAPADYALLMDSFDGQDIGLVEDPELESGRCIVESGPTVLDVSVIEKFDVLRTTLVDTYRQRAVTNG